MAGGASSRMKHSLYKSQLTSSQKSFALGVHKSLIPLGKSQKPLIYYLISNASQAGYTDVYLITSPENDAFQKWIGNATSGNLFAGAYVHYVIQYPPEGRPKPLGTADAVTQALEQYPKLQQQQFTVCNGDNLYSQEALKQLLEPRKAPHALISYARSALRFENERIAKFAIIDIDKSNFLKAIIEKPDPSVVKKYKDEFGEIGVSMNIFSFQGEALYPFLKNCPIHPERGEKELPEAIRLMNEAQSGKIHCFKRAEHILDLTAAEDIAAFEEL